MWDWANGTSLLGYDSGHRGNVFQAKFLPIEGEFQIVSCGRDGQIRVADISRTGKCLGTRKLGQHKGSAHKLTTIEYDPFVFMCCGEDGCVIEIDLRDPKPHTILVCREQRQPHAHGTDEPSYAKVPLYSIHSRPLVPHEFVVSGKDQYVRVFDRRCLGDTSDGVDLSRNSSSHQRPVKKFCPEHLDDKRKDRLWNTVKKGVSNAANTVLGREPKKKRDITSPIKPNVTCAVYNYNGSEILATYNDELIYTFDANHYDGASHLHQYKGHRNNATVKGVNWFGPRSEYVVSGSDCGHVYMWEKESETIVQYMMADEGGVVNCLEGHPYMPILATSGLDSDAKIWIPSSDDPPGIRNRVKKLQKLMRHNDRARHRDLRSNSSTASAFDSPMIWFMLSRMRRATREATRRRNRQRQSGDGDAAAEGDTAGEANEDDDDDEEDTSMDFMALDEDSDDNDSNADGTGERRPRGDPSISCRTS